MKLARELKLKDALWFFPVRVDACCVPPAELSDVAFLLASCLDLTLFVYPAFM